MGRRAVAYRRVAASGSCGCAGDVATWRRELTRRREAGELLDTIDVLAVHGIEAELRARGWSERRHQNLLPIAIRVRVHRV